MKNRVLVTFAIAFLPLLLIAQHRDSKAIAVLNQSVLAMGGSAPSDSAATGQIALSAGSKEEVGTIRVLTRGTDQSLVEVTTDERRTIVYSRGHAVEKHGLNARKLQLELAMAGQAIEFPLPLLVRALAEDDVSVTYVGLEQIDGISAHHIRFAKSFVGREFQSLTELSRRDLWIDAATGLPKKLSYEIRSARGASAAIPVEVWFSDFRVFGEVLYPTSVIKHLNGTPWAVVRIESVVLNAGLSDADFKLD